MSKRLTILVVLTMAVIGAGMATMGFFTDGQAKQDTPILYMTPSDLFSNRQLRQLAEAAQHGNVKKIDALIANGVSVNSHGKYGIGPLFSAVQADNKRGFKVLLDHGANPNNIWTNGYTLMNTIACCAHDPYFMEQALKHGGNPNLVEPHTGKTPIIAATTVSGKVNIPPLIKAGANLDYQTSILKGKDPKYPPSGGETAMMEASGGPLFDVVYELLKAGANYRLKDGQGWSLEDDIKFSFRASLSPDQVHWREKAIEFLKQYHAWSEKSAYDAWLGKSVNPRLPLDNGSRSRASAAPTAQAVAQEITNYEAPGNLQSTHELGCLSVDKLSNKDTPADLYPALVKCLNQDQYDRALFIYALAGAYTRFDTLRVADETAHDAATVFLHRVIAAVPKDKMKKLASQVDNIVGDPKQLSALCAQLRKFGPPDYYPRYMVQHGMQAFTGLKTPKGLVPDFDAKKAWEESLSSYLHCPDVHDEKP